MVIHIRGGLILLPATDMDISEAVIFPKLPRIYPWRLVIYKRHGYSHIHGGPTKLAATDTKHIRGGFFFLTASDINIYSHIRGGRTLKTASDIEHTYPRRFLLCDRHG